MNNNPKISVCVPIYGVEVFIERCARSLFEQSYSNIEYVFVNDATPDYSMNILGDVISDYPNRQSQIKIISLEKNHGLAHARNVAIKNVTGEFILHVDSDDYIEINTVKECVEKQMEANSDIVTFNYNFCSNSEIVKYSFPVFSNTSDRTVALLSRSIAVCIWAGMYRRDLYDNMDAIVTDGINYSEDYNVTPILSYYCKRISHIDKALYNYNIANENSYTYCFSEKNKRQLWITFEKLSSFFCDKGSQYVDALERSKLSSIVDCLLACNGNLEYSNFIGFLLIRLDEIDKKYWRCLSLKKNIYIYIYRTKIYKIIGSRILHFYYSCMNG